MGEELEETQSWLSESFCNFKTINFSVFKEYRVVTGPWWSSGLERHSFVLVMLKVEGSNPGIVVFFRYFDPVE